MKVIMLNDVRETGRRGDVVEVKPGFARNYLLPQRLAALATEGNIKWFEQQRKKIEAKIAAERAEHVEAAAQIEGTTVEIAKRAGESETLYGSVLATEIQIALEEKGIEVDAKTIDLGGGIKTLGDHEVRVVLHPDVAAQITVRVIQEA